MRFPSFVPFASLAGTTAFSVLKKMTPDTFFCVVLTPPVGHLDLDALASSGPLYSLAVQSNHHPHPHRRYLVGSRGFVVLV